ncbi:unnamed protein product [Cyprideis torosa]|uniref:Uncharacterized protein n=1 Tax=Cyprideis torosa TaxID=163714 RepID=A0A7R8W9D0_9CRUS|nr:unnamed protein product [Cyprideis torosa]CAG0888395.1 unnamed protein product [Cyprideis torosa]
METVAEFEQGVDRRYSQQQHGCQLQQNFAFVPVLTQSHSSDMALGYGNSGQQFESRAYTAVSHAGHMLNFRPTNGQRDEQEPENKTNDSEVDLESVLTVFTEADWRDLIPETFQGRRSQGVQLNVR